jgi:hypothetical protein
MDLEEVLEWLNDEGFAFQWRTEPKVNDDEAILRPPAGQSIALGPVDVGIVIPDVHLGVGNDVFQTVDPTGKNAARFLQFLQALARLRDEVGAAKFRTVQVGDWYDFFRAPALTADQQVAAIEAQYGDVCRAARALPVMHCVGNHDAALYKMPNATASRFGIAQPIGTNRVMAYHGHDTATLEAIREQDLGAAIGLNIVDLVALLPILGQIVDFAQMVIDDSFQEPWTKGNTGGDNPWPKSAGAAPVGWTAPWVARDDAAGLVKAARGIEYVTDMPIQVAFIGHSHRPGISSAWITAERQVALVDAGSWTYGRAEIAIVTRDGVGLAEIPIV